MVRRSPLSPISLQRRRPRPAHLDLTQSTFSSTGSAKTHIDSTQIVHITKDGPYIFHDGEEDENARASAELVHAQTLFSASLESDPIPCVRARSPSAYRAAGKLLPMEVEVTVEQEIEGRPSLDTVEEFRFPLPVGGYTFPPVPADDYQFPPPTITAPRPSVVTIDLPGRNRRCFPVPWLNIMRTLRAKGRRRRPISRQLPEPLGFHERIAHAEHEWRPVYPSRTHDQDENKGAMCKPEVVSSLHAEWPWR